jgi:two-component system, OmpR family, alkaline phosphatase synthesis response regulator PhoP
MPTILCIDDDVNFLELEKSILETNGYTVVTASDGPTGITLASKSPIDVVVLAFKMRGMNGGQVAEVLLKHQPDLPNRGLYRLVRGGAGGAKVVRCYMCGKA